MSIKKSKEIAEAIRKARKLRGYTQQEVALKIGMTTSNYQKIEYSQIKLGIDSRLLDICKVLKISIISLLEDYYSFKDVHFNPADKIDELSIGSSPVTKSEGHSASRTIKYSVDHAKLISAGMHFALRLLTQAKNNEQDVDKGTLSEIDSQIRIAVTLFDLIKDGKVKGEGYPD